MSFITTRVVLGQRLTGFVPIVCNHCFIFILYILFDISVLVSSMFGDPGVVIQMSILITFINVCVQRTVRYFLVVHLYQLVTSSSRKSYRYFQREH